MKKLIAVFSVVALASVITTSCSSGRTTRTTTRESVESTPLDPIVTERRSTTHTETRTND